MPIQVTGGGNLRISDDDDRYFHPLQLEADGIYYMYDSLVDGFGGDGNYGDFFVVLLKKHFTQTEARVRTCHEEYLAKVWIPNPDRGEDFSDPFVELTRDGKPLSVDGKVMRWENPHITLVG